MEHLLEIIQVPPRGAVRVGNNPEEEKRSHELLRRFLSEEEQELLSVYGRLPIVGSLGSKYVLRPDAAWESSGSLKYGGMVDVRRDQEAFGVYPQMQMPLGDYLLLLKFRIEGCEREFINESCIYRGEQVWKYPQGHVAGARILEIQVPAQ